MTVEGSVVENYDAMDGILRGDAYAKGLGFTLEDWGGGWARVRYAVPHSHANFNGGLHGGAIFSLADNAFGVASNSWGRISVAIAMEAHFVSAPNFGDMLVAESTEQSRTRRTASHIIKVVGHDDRLVASVHAMVYRTSQWHLGEDAWSPEWREHH